MPLNRTWRIGLGLVGAILVAPFVGWAVYSGVVWLSFGRTSSRAAPDPVADLYMPSYDIREVHQTRVAAPATRAFRVATEMDLLRSGVTRAIFRGREMILGSNSPPLRELRLTRELIAIGWGVLHEVPGREIVFGAVTQPWKKDVVFRSLPPASFAAFDSADYVKIVVTFAADSTRPDESVFRTETRVKTTDAAARSKFRRYWSIFSPGILLIRSQALRLVRREAAHSQPAP